MGYLSRFNTAQRSNAHPVCVDLEPSRTLELVGRWRLLTSTVFGLLILGAAGMLAGCPARQANPTAVSNTLYKRDLSAGLHNITLPRGEMKPLGLPRDGEMFPCSSCHEGFAGDMGQQALEDEHKDIVFQHGLNQSCLNCHNSKNSDTYVNHDGSEIPGDQPTQLCGKCHGPQYREWMEGVHGRLNQHWDAKFGEQTKAHCVQCHDPHRPAYAPLVPAPPPRLTRFQELPKGGNEHDQ